MYEMLRNHILNTTALLAFVLVLFLAPIGVSLLPENEGVTQSYGQNAITGSSFSLVHIDLLVTHAEDEAPAPDWTKTAVQFMGNLLLQAAGMITWLGGQLLNLTIEFTIKNIGEVINTGGIGLQIDELWTVIRDVANLIFIFGFVYIGIMTIVSPGSTRTKSFLAQLIISALLINFSLFFVKIVVDVTNVLALEIYNLMGGGDPTLQIMRQMGISTFYANSSPAELAEASDKISFYIAGAAFLIVAGIVFAVGAFMLISRFIAIILLMIFSPIMIAGFVFPGTKKTAKELWARLFGYSLYPAIFLFLLYLSIKMLGTSSLDTSGASLAAALSRGDTGDGDLAIILRFAIAIGFLIAAMQVSKHFSNFMGNRAASLEGWARSKASRFVGGTTSGLAAAGLRGTVGRAGASLANSDKLKDFAATNAAGRTLLRASVGASKASFDARQVAGVGNKLGAGEGRKGGYAAITEEKQKKDEETAKLLGQVGDDDIRVRAKQEAVGAKEKEIRRLKELKSTAATADDKAKIAEQIAAEERALQDLKNDVEKEKNRRILGTSYEPDDLVKDIAELKKETKKQKDAIRDAAVKYAEAKSDAERKAAEELYDAAVKAKKEADEKIAAARKRRGVRGFADTREDMGRHGGLINGAMMMARGRNKGMNKDIADELRKKYSKKMKEDDKK